MGIPKPFKRTYRQNARGSDHYGYVVDPQYATDPLHYIRAFLVIQKDALELFDYVEPSETNVECYSYRIHELHTRACIEIEANCRAILSENGYSRGGDWNMSDYKKLESSHLLSQYQIKLPVWHGTGSTRSPFQAWVTGGSLGWYQAYNQTKHSRHQNFSQANFGNMVDAVTALAAVLASQFYIVAFDGAVWGKGRDADGFAHGIGDYFRIKFPTNWPQVEQYDFDWKALKQDASRFQDYPYP